MILVTVLVLLGSIRQCMTTRFEQCRPNLVCPLTKQEVCGTDGSTYTNDCFLRRARCQSGGKLSLAYRGPCGTGKLCRKICPITYQPVCGDDGNTYASECILDSNNCLYNKSVRKAHDGTCKEANTIGKTCGTPCARNDSPVCGSNGVTYSNECEFRERQCQKGSDLSISYFGKCEQCQIQNCQQLYQPVCGTDGHTYVNECVLSNSACKDRNIKRKYFGACEYCGKNCDDVLQPICGSDGHTYESDCHLEQANCKRKYDDRVHKLNDGRCKILLQWKEICTLPKSSGERCNTRRSRAYFYNTSSGFCETFVYSGCGGNENRFLQKDICVSSCARNCDMKCSATEEPVCGSNGRFYRNKCVLALATCRSWDKITLAPAKTCSGPGVSSIGEGKCDRSCNMLQKQVCGTDGQTYVNDCFLSIKTCETEGKVLRAYAGKCLSKNERCVEMIITSSSCDQLYYTYNYKTGDCETYQGCQNYDNPNSFKTKTDCLKECKPSCSTVTCPDVQSAVCGTDLKVYVNTCYLSVASCLSHGKIGYYHAGVCGGQQSK